MAILKLWLLQVWGLNGNEKLPSCGYDSYHMLCTYILVRKSEDLEYYNFVVLCKLCDV